MGRCSTIKGGFNVNIQENSIVYPLPSDELLAEKEGKWRVTLPNDYKRFIIRYNGGIPNQKSFQCNNHDYAITRFLCILKNVEDVKSGWYDISVVESQIGERLTDNEDLIGIEVLPIAELFAGDYVCLDFRKGNENPSVCVWSHEESGEFDPITYRIADSFSEFIDMLV